MTHDTSRPLDDEALWTAFTTSRLAAADWHHRSHLRVAFLHLARWELDEAHLRMRVGIIRLNAFHGLEETASRGYHETLTRVWLVLVADAKTRSPATSQDSDAFLIGASAKASELLDKELPLRFYTRETLFGLRARTIFVEPDRMPLALT